MSEKMTSDEAASLREAISEYESWGSLVAQQIAENMRSILEKFGPKQESELRYSERDAMEDKETDWKPPHEMTIGPLCWQLGADGRYTFIDGAIGGRYQCGASESLLVKRLAAAEQDLAELRKQIASLRLTDAEREAMRGLMERTEVRS
jgi:hypothetical protein